MLEIKDHTFLLADNFSVARQGISEILKEIIKDPILYYSSSLVDILQIIKTNSIEILVIDINLKKFNCNNYIKTIRAIKPDIKILIFTGINEKLYAFRYLNMGFDGFLSKSSTESEIKEAIICFLETGKYVSQKVKEQIIEYYINKIALNPIERLTLREVEIACLLVKGFSISRISIEMQLFKTTVSTYKKKIFKKVGATNIASLIEIFNFFDIDTQ